MQRISFLVILLIEQKRSIIIILIQCFINKFYINNHVCQYSAVTFYYYCYIILLSQLTAVLMILQHSFKMERMVIVQDLRILSNLYVSRHALSRKKIKKIQKIPLDVYVYIHLREHKHICMCLCFSVFQFISPV